MCTYERKKILPIKLYPTIIRCIPIPDMLKCGGEKHVLQLMKHRMSAAVNSDVIEDSGFDHREVLCCFLLFLIGFTVFCPFSGGIVLTCLKRGDDKPCVDQEHDITLGCPGWEG